MTGRLYGIGLGPGDPELLTLKALRLIQSSPVVSYFAKAGRRGNARTIVDQWMTGKAEEVPLHYPMTTEHAFDSPVYVSVLAAFYEEAVATLSAHLDAGRDVALLAEGDPLFYGSFMHLYIRLRDRYPVTLVPGVTGMTGCWSVAGEPMTWGDDTMSVLPGTLPREGLVERLMATDAAVIMKLGRNFAKVREAVAEAGLLDRAIYVERGTMADELVMPLAEKIDGKAPYFSLILIPGQGRRP
ncbi:MAG TPA: precorrin-2 C(20)-methyltransferase [Alphaproteobacteria bacterium]|jgi:precorrin-2/cobalt-factor-2 C20-methyltransferase|nr:precorrin-2 C(20)-methyltransferase [Alphaproteobacteria bacterium]